MSLRFQLRVQDVLLTVMFGALIYLAHDISEKSLILGLAVLQLVEGRIPFLTTRWGRAMSVVLQLMIIWVLIGYTHGVNSRYYLMLLLPLLSAASYLGLAGTVTSSAKPPGRLMPIMPRGPS